MPHGMLVTNIPRLQRLASRPVRRARRSAASSGADKSCTMNTSVVNGSVMYTASDSCVAKHASITLRGSGLRGATASGAAIAGRRGGHARGQRPTYALNSAVFPQQRWERRAR